MILGLRSEQFEYHCLGGPKLPGASGLGAQRSSVRHFEAHLLAVGGPGVLAGRSGVVQRVDPSSRSFGPHHQWEAQCHPCADSARGEPLDLELTSSECSRLLRRVLKLGVTRAYWFGRTASRQLLCHGVASTDWILQQAGC